MSTRRGLRRHRIMVQARSGALDAAGQPLEDWSTVAERWASVTPLTGDERVAAQARGAKVPTRIVTQFTCEARQENRITWRHRDRVRVFDIISAIDPENDGVDLEILADELAGVAP